MEIELMKRCKKGISGGEPDYRLVFSMYEDFHHVSLHQKIEDYAKSALRLGALDYISKISFDGDDELTKVLENQSERLSNRGRDPGSLKRLLKTTSGSLN